MAAASSILVGLLLSSKTISDPSLDKGTGVTTQVPWYLDLPNLARFCPEGQCDNTPIGLVQGNFQKKNKDCLGGRCGVPPVNALQKSIHNLNTDCIRGRCDVSPLSLLQEKFHNSNNGCKGANCKVAPTSFHQGSSQNKGCLGGRCDVTSTFPGLENFQNQVRECSGEHCQVTTEGPTLGGFQGTADPFEDYFVTENTLAYESDSQSTNPLIFSEPMPILKRPSKGNIPNSFPNSVVSTFSPTVGEVITGVRNSASVDPPRNIVQVPSSSNIAPSQGFVYVDFGENEKGYGGDGSIRVVSQENDNTRFQRESSIVDKDNDFWNSINGILGGELEFLNKETLKQDGNNNINIKKKNNNINVNSQGHFNTNNAEPLIEDPREARSFTSYPGPSVGAPSRGFITVNFGGDPDDWGPGGFIRVVSHE